nr:hypothetical protein [Tanacetum cinerariifolium]
MSYDLFCYTSLDDQDEVNSELVLFTDPTYTDIKKLYAHHEEKDGFSGMIGIIDCTAWTWENYPVASIAQFFKGDHGPGSFILLEALGSQDLWIWHAFFVVFRKNNDMNLFRQSSIFNDLNPGKHLMFHLWLTK